MKFVLRMAAVWHPIEEMDSFIRLVRAHSDASVSPINRLFSPTTRPFLSDASEVSDGFQGAAVLSQGNMEIGERLAELSH